MYESPIHLLVQQLETSIREQQEKQIFEAVQKCGVDVDRDELIKALAYDRAQYAQGYSDGRADAQRWISVKDRLPEEFENVLAIVQYNEDTWNCKIAYIMYGVWRVLDDYTVHSVVTWWMPIPPKPGIEKED